jgi:hypothetical protein
MCGIPLPHRPLTTPGAQSTASLTRPLAENAGAREPQIPRDHAGLDTSSNRATGEPPPSSNLAQPSQDQTAERDAPASEAQSPHFELVPEIPLHEYVQNFRYVPPNDPDESTMRGEAPVLRPHLVASSHTVSAPMETATATTEDAPADSAADDVRERLGLEDASAADERSDRPRFLDFNEPSKPTQPAASAQRISGPSFLGLNDPPPAEADTDDEFELEGPARGRWRIALAVVVVLVFGVLGVLEWQAQVRQTNNGPVEVVKMKMRGVAPTGPIGIIKAKMQGLVHRLQAESASPEPASPATSADSASQPEMKVEPPPKPQGQNPAADTAASPPATDAATAPDTNAAARPSATSAPAPSGNQPAAPSAAPPQNPAPNPGGTPAEQNAAVKPATSAPAVDKSKAAGAQPPGAAAKPTAAKPKPSPPAAADDQEVVVRRIAPGADELARADNASDSAAEAAWLWKATAKGNPTAPVRLADMYVKGEGVPRSCEQALVLLKTAAEKENSLARNQLASMYSSGICVARSRVEAYRWVSAALAANPNSDWAQQRRDQLWQQMTPEERALAQKYR